jgi:hypothetical protein
MACHITAEAQRTTEEERRGKEEIVMEMRENTENRMQKTESLNSEAVFKDGLCSSRAGFRRRKQCMKESFCTQLL